jgi:hypothetical protein
MKRTLILNEPSIGDLERICDVLNGRKAPQVTPELVRLVRLWEGSGRNLQKMMHANSELWRDVQDVWRAEWFPTKSGGAKLALFPDLPISKMKQDGPTPEGQALLLFHALTLGHWEKLCESPCARCGNYYIKKRKSQKVYCSRRCGSLASAEKSTRERLNQEHTQNIDRARKAIREWKPSNGDWKEFVSGKTGLTVKWVSRNTANKKYPHRELRQPSQTKKER